jgi:acyl carrier protein
LNTAKPLSFDRFAENLADILELDPAAFQPEARFAEDLGLDSFDLVEILVFVENLGVHLSDELAAELDTVDDLYREYRSRANSSDHDDQWDSIA